MPGTGYRVTIDITTEQRPCDYYLVGFIFYDDTVVHIGFSDPRGV